MSFARAVAALVAEARRAGVTEIPVRELEILEGFKLAGLEHQVVADVQAVRLRRPGLSIRQVCRIVAERHGELDAERVRRWFRGLGDAEPKIDT